MKLPPLEMLDGDTLVFSPSGLDLLKACQRHWSFRYLWRRQRATFSASQVAGKAFHAALQLRYQMARSGPVTPEVQEAMEARLSEGFQGVELPLDEHRTETRFREVLRGFNKHYGAENFEVLGCEVPLAVPLGEVEPPDGFWMAATGRTNFKEGSFYKKPVRVVLKGIIDRLLRMADGTVMVADTKTMSDWKEQQQTAWQAAAAPKAYAWGLQELSRRHPELGLPTQVHGFLLEAVVVRKPLSPDTQAKAEKSAAYAAKLRPREEFFRLPFYYSQESLEEWRANTLAWVRTLLDNYARGELPYNERHCCNWYSGNCPFWDCCSQPVAQRELVLASDLYMPYERSPFEGVAEEQNL